MLAQLARLPGNDADYGFEFKWDGYRAITYIEDGKHRVMTRGGKDYSDHFPELAALLGTIKTKTLVIDGEIVAFDEKGRVSFQALQRRMGRAGAGTAIAYMIFDLLHE